MTTQARPCMRTSTHTNSPGDGWQCSDTSWANNETQYPPLPDFKKLVTPIRLGVKSLRAKWIILQLLLLQTHIIHRLFTAHYIHKSPNLLHTAVKKKSLQIWTHSQTPTTPLPFFLQIPSLSFPSLLSSLPPWHTIHMYKSTVLQSHTHTHRKRFTQTGTYTQKQTHTILVLGVISLTQGTVIIYFQCSSQGQGIRGQQTAAKPNTSHPTVMER